MFCAVLAISLMASIPSYAFASDKKSTELDNMTGYHSTYANTSDDDSSIRILNEGEFFTYRPIQIKEIHKKADVNYNVLSGFGNILYQKSIIIDDVENSLLCTFEDLDQSLNIVQSKCNKILDILSNKYHVDKLDNNNWKEYQILIDNYSSDPESNKMYEEHGELLKQYYSLQAFLQIYEDSFINKEVLDFINIANQKLKDKSISKIVLDDLKGHLPYTDPIVKDNQKTLELVQSDNSNKPQCRQIMGLKNLTAANNYALAYAEHPNPNYRFFNNGDCTNFVSQICYTGGVPMSNSWYYTGWGLSPNTKTWTVAHEFANYWKPRWYTGLTKDHFYKWSEQLYTKGGSVIGMDTAGNKRYHHLAYVTKRANNKKTKFGRTFYDFYICQHSSNYQSWASDNKGTANGWLNQPDGTIFAIFS